MTDLEKLSTSIKRWTLILECWFYNIETCSYRRLAIANLKVKRSDNHQVLFTKALCKVKSH